MYIIHIYQVYDILLHIYGILFSQSKYFCHFKYLIFLFIFSAVIMAHLNIFFFFFLIKRQRRSNQTERNRAPILVSCPKQLRQLLQDRGEARSQELTWVLSLGARTQLLQTSPQQCPSVLITTKLESQAWAGQCKNTGIPGGRYTSGSNIHHCFKFSLGNCQHLFHI